MKKVLYIASMCLAMAFTSCDDFLTVSSPDKLTTGNFWRDQKDAEATLASAYAQLYHGDSYATSEVRWPVEAYRTDLYDVGNDANNYQTWTDIYNFTYTNGNTQFSYYYQDLYRGINFTNQVLEYAPKIPAENITEAKRGEIIAEAHFLRGYVHMMLLLNWEKIILRDIYISDAADLNKPLSDRVACWELVISELSQATALPATRPGSELGRATSGAANAYLGFAYLTRAYEEPANESAHLTAALKALNEVQGTRIARNRSSSCNILPTLTMAPATTHTYTVSLPALRLAVGMKSCPVPAWWKSTRKKAERHRTGCTTNVFIIRFTSRMTTSTTLITAN